MLNRKSILALIAFFLLACHGRRPVEFISQPAQDWLRSIPEGRAQLKSLRAETRVDVRRKGRRIKFKASILVADPDKLYVETSGFGFVSSSVLVNEKETLIFLPSKNEAYVGNGGEGLAAILGVRMATREWVHLLLGGVTSYPNRILSMEETNSESTLNLGEGLEITRVTFDRETGWVKSFEQKGTTSKKITFGEPMGTAAGEYPSRMTIETPQGSVDIRFETVTANPKLPEDVFILTLPPTVQPVPLKTDEILKGE